MAVPNVIKLMTSTPEKSKRETSVQSRYLFRTLFSVKLAWGRLYASLLPLAGQCNLGLDTPDLEKYASIIKAGGWSVFLPVFKRGEGTRAEIRCSPAYRSTNQIGG